MVVFAVLVGWLGVLDLRVVSLVGCVLATRFGWVFVWLWLCLGLRVGCCFDLVAVR